MKAKRLLEHYYDEGDSAYIYSILAKLAKNKNTQKIYKDLKNKELEHQQKFAELLKKQNHKIPQYKPSLKIKLMGFLAKKGFANSVLKLRIYDESREIKTYFLETKDTGGVTRGIARDEALHARILKNQLGGGNPEIWHKAGSGGLLSNVVYGFNDGLTANFGLLMGVIGASNPHNVIVLSGIAGLIADTLSMGSSSYLAAVSEKEVYKHEISLEKEEIELMPEAEEAELALIYQAKGIPEKVSYELAKNAMKNNREQVLQEMATQELGISQVETSPLKDGFLTGIATFFGALIPILPLFFGASKIFIIISFAISMISHFIVGALRSVFTGRSAIRSGIDMFLVGLGVAIIGYGIGFLITK